MEKYILNINKLNEIKDGYHAAWLISDLKQKGIILEIENKEYTPTYLKALFIMLSEGILNSNTKLKAEDRTQIDYAKYEFSNFQALTKALTEVTNLRFSYKLTESIP